MKITKSQLRRVIEEEVGRIMDEDEGTWVKNKHTGNVYQVQNVDAKFHEPISKKTIQKAAGQDAIGQPKPKLIYVQDLQSGNVKQMSSDKFNPKYHKKIPASIMKRAMGGPHSPAGKPKHDDSVPAPGGVRDDEKITMADLDKEYGPESYKGGPPKDWDEMSDEEKAAERQMAGLTERIKRLQRQYK